MMASMAEAAGIIRAMRIVVLGAGGVGGYFGGRLADAGADVTFFARGATLDALRTHGLRVDSINGDIVIPKVQATDDATSIAKPTRCSSPSSRGRCATPARRFATQCTMTRLSCRSKTAWKHPTTSPPLS